MNRAARGVRERAARDVHVQRGRLWGILRFEVAYQVRRPWPWLFAAVLLVVVFLMTRDAALADALYEDFFVNSPFAIATTTVFGSVIWLLVAPVVAGDAAARDVATGMHPLTYTAPVGKAEYLGGRFLAALVLNASILLAVPAGILLAVHSPGVSAEVVGPFRPAAYVTAYAYIALPNALVATAIQYSLATRTGRAMSGFAGSLLLVFLAFFVASFLLFKQGLGTLLDPIGMRFIVEDLPHLWTPVEKGSRLLELEGAVLTNRLLWSAIALGVLAATYLRFSFAHRAERGWWWRRTRRGTSTSPGPAGAGITMSTPIAVAGVRRTFGVAIRARQTLAIAWGSFRAVAASWSGLALLAGIPLLTIPVVIDQMVSNGVPLVPTTVQVLGELTAPLSAELSRWVIVPLLMVFFAGELVWREREAGMGEITDAMAGSEWVPLLGKLLGLALVLAAFTALQMTAGMLAQAIMGHDDFQVALYIKVLFGLQLPEYLLFAVLAVVVHVLVDQKYIAHLVAIVAYVFIALAAMFGVEHDLLIYGAGPGWSYSEMRGFGASLGPWWWFKLYWAAWALLLAVAARLLWGRGKEGGLGVRLQLARRRMRGATAWTAVAAVGLILTLGAFNLHNTNVLNEYRTASDEAERSAEYERRYRRFAGSPQPRMTGATLHVEIHPERWAVEIRGSYRLVNQSGAAIDSIHVATAVGVETGAVTFDRPATRVLADARLGHRIYALGRALQPGDSLWLGFQVQVAPRGFSERGADASVAPNGTSFTNGWLPAIGYHGARELVRASDRREHGLAPRPLIPYLDDIEARKDRGAGITFEAVMVTDAGQVAVAPGALRRTWSEGGRRYFHYATDAPIGGEWGFFSANYAMHRAQWKDVEIRIFHHPGHTAQLDRMVRSIRASLDYYTEQFGPYRHRHLTVVERPGNGTGMHADPGMLSYAEGFSTWNPGSDPGDLDFPFAVVAHELAHQWTVPYAPVEGAPVMSEGVAWYYAIKLVEYAKGRGELQRLLGYLRQPHPIRQIRRGEPLLRGLDPYLSRRRAPFALHALSEYVGEERVHGALRRLLEQHRPAEAPLATTLDLYGELQAVTPDSLRSLLHDLFEVNAFWEFETERATAVETAAGSWQVTLDVRARKAVYDSAGAETEMPMDEWVEVGIFAPDTNGGESGAPLHLQKHRIRSGAQRITVTVPRRPARAGIDPFHLLDWEARDDDDNVVVVRIGAEGQ